MIADITIDRLLLHARHGVGEQERRVGADYEVSVTMQVDVAEAVAADNVDRTVDYSRVVATVGRVMAVPARLIETVAARIVAAIKAEHPAVQGGSVTVIKLLPPMKCQLRGVSVTLRF